MESKTNVCTQTSLLGVFSVMKCDEKEPITFPFNVWSSVNHKKKIKWQQPNSGLSGSILHTYQNTHARKPQSANEDKSTD